MNRDATILDRVYQITRGHLDTATVSLPDLSAVTHAMAWSEVQGTSAFWRDRSVDPPVSLPNACRDLVTGLAHLGTPCSFWIVGVPTGISIRLGVPQVAGRAVEALRGLLIASYPDVRLGQPSAPAGPPGWERFPALLLGGIPREKTGATQRDAVEHVEKLCRAFTGARWSYMVCAEPVQRAEVTAALNQVSAEIRSVLGTTLLKGTPDEENRVARLYVDLLQAQSKRLESARGSGLWTVRAFLLAEDGAWLARGGAAALNAFGGEESVPVPFRLVPCERRGEATRPDPELLTSRELSILVRVPRESYSGYEVVEPARFSLHGPASRTAPAGSVHFGEIMDRGQSLANPFQVALNDIAKHVLIAGVTGSGKTNTAFRLLETLWVDHHVPFLVLESAKSEYRDLLAIPEFADLRVYTLGDETVAPFRLNPFEVPEGALVQAHLDYVKALFAASFVLYPPMPYVLEQSLQEIYEERGWDLAANVNRRGRDSTRAFPNLTDLYTKIETVVHRMGYDQRLTMDITAGLQARVNQLRIGGGKGRMLDTRRSLPCADLFARPCVLELKQIVSDDEKAFMIGLIMVRLLEHLELQGPGDGGGGLRHVLLVEEAHRLLRNVSEQAGEDTANPRGRAVEVFANILSEVRAYGEGIVILEQIPTKLTPDAVKNTNLKIVHRLVAREDREQLGATMQTDAQQSAHFGVLGAGEAVVFAEGMKAPALIAVPLCAAKARRWAAVDEAQVRQRWAKNTDRALFQRSSWCASCPRLEAQSRCGADLAVWRGARAAVFEAFYSALAHNHAFLWDTYADVELACRSVVSSRDVDTICTINAFLEEAIESRAMAAGWRFSTAAELAAAASAVTRQFVSSAGAPDADAKRSLSRIAGRYGRLLDGLCRSEVGPCAGCVHCEQRCLFRYEASGLVRNEDAREQFQLEFAESSGDPARLSAVAWGMSRAYVHAKDVITRRALASCFAAQQTVELRLSTSNQRLLVGEVCTEIHKLAEEEHGDIAK